MLVNVTKLDKELKAAGIPIDGVGKTNGEIRIDFKPDATQAQRKAALELLAAHDPRDYEVESQQKALGEFRALTVLANKTDVQIGAWVDSNVTDLASAKAAIKLLARAVGALARDRGVV